MPRYINVFSGTIKKPRAVAGFRGTVKYAPVACHAQRELCRLDDLETWLYMIVEFTKGSLPWRNLKSMNEIGEMKKSCRFDIPMKQLFGGCPREFIAIMRTIDGGKFFDEPDYNRMYSLLRQAMKNMNAQEFPYDWEKWEEERKKREEAEKTKAKTQAKTEPTSPVPKTQAKDKSAKEMGDVYKSEIQKREETKKEKKSGKEKAKEKEKEKESGKEKEKEKESGKEKEDKDVNVDVDDDKKK